MSANDRQVGGLHYKSAYNHWDFVKAVNLGYLEGQVTRYVMRARKKNGLQDLEKSIHFVDKMLEDVDPERADWEVDWQHIKEQTSLFAAANNLTVPEQIICEGIASWTTKEDLIAVRAKIEALIFVTKTVPLEDSNKHADRVWHRTVE